ncbi:PREDICTED: LOW QUALITY PROTEIN: uncharacterized protein LOC105957593 [Erythranthe guttata]|uniref:LOW QUALITY PROTEIN: uncharacterized protein LOC105957593 n=1 Tax=Erythranthe guttata TaxID=4155 RepID=UPI00064DCFBE|nr:PREDICTED: LOW QUALITY PROTEIN: uncharacterized protein LOC105957593 [Erythranthe guttata]|eukprot:XP_012836984.1 PREDICTED: LOW QUALITY PROTEIN: uncharacterized protein LOC105957593 [Erythranthe guttata]
MIQTAQLNCSMRTFLVEPNVFPHYSKPAAASRSSASVSSAVCYSVSRNDESIPKLEPFSRNKFDRASLRNPPLIQKSENQIADYCVTLDGDDSYSCWEAYFELKDLEKEAPKEEVEKLIMEAGGVKSLIGCVHGVAAIHKEKKESTDSLKLTKIENTRAENPRPVPDGLPKTSEELEEEENAKMPDSPFTRLLRARGTHPAWYSQAPEHETD